MHPTIFVPKGPGPVKWCKHCSRRHPARACELVEVERVSYLRFNKDGTYRRGGTQVKRLTHPKPLRKKTRRVREEHAQESIGE